MSDPSLYLIWVGMVSMVTFIATLAAIPMLVVRIPEDYFVSDHRPAWKWGRLHPVLYLIAIVLKNVTGIVFLAAGLVMLFIPGQGVITILLGLTFMNFPGKRHLEKAIVRFPAVNRTINWMRRRAHRPDLCIPAK